MMYDVPKSGTELPSGVVPYAAVVIPVLLAPDKCTPLQLLLSKT